MIDGHLRFVHVNHALAKYHDRAPEDFVAMKVETLLPKQIWEIVAPLYRYVLETRLPVTAFEFETQALGAQPGSTLLCRASSSSLAVNGLLARVSYQAAIGGESGCNQGNGSPAFDQLLSTLTRAELPVSNLIGSGKCTKEIAAALHISDQTVATHRKNICRKLAIHSTAELVHLATSCRNAGVRN